MRVGIAGGSCSGKSALATSLSRRWGAEVLSLDDYYRDLAHLEPATREARNFDHPDALDWDLLRSHLAELGRGGEVRVPTYDFSTHRRGSGRIVQAGGAGWILEGIFVLRYSDLRVWFDFTVFIDLPEVQRLERRLARDTRERGRDARSVREQHASSVEPMYREFVLPTREYADLTLDGRLATEAAADLVASAVG